MPKLEGLTISNGLGWSRDRSSHVVHRHAVAAGRSSSPTTASWASGRTFATIDRADGLPDGLAVDDEDCVWVALWGGSSVRRYTPDGDLDRVIALPAENVTSCCFGGSTLYITTAAPDGRLFVTDAGVTGPPAQPFRSTAPSDAEPTSAR